MKNIKPNEILYSKGKNDECYTPAYGVKPILKYIKKHLSNKLWLRGIVDLSDKKDLKLVKAYNKKREAKRTSPLEESLIVWCPFDMKDSEYVKLISKLDNVEVVYSHIEAGEDFF
jgi:hypothetical protein